MSMLDDIFARYVELRASGREAITALESLRFTIELLSATEQADLVKRVRQWEVDRLAKGGTNATADLQRSATTPTDPRQQRATFSVSASPPTVGVSRCRNRHRRTQPQHRRM